MDFKEALVIVNEVLPETLGRLTIKSQALK